MLEDPLKWHYGLWMWNEKTEELERDNAEISMQSNGPEYKPGALAKLEEEKKPFFGKREISLISISTSIYVNFFIVDVTER